MLFFIKITKAPTLVPEWTTIDPLWSGSSMQRYTLPASGPGSQRHLLPSELMTAEAPDILSLPCGGNTSRCLLGPDKPFSTEPWIERQEVHPSCSRAIGEQTHRGVLWAQLRSSRNEDPKQPRYEPETPSCEFVSAKLRGLGQERTVSTLASCWYSACFWSSVVGRFLDRQLWRRGP